MTSKTFIVRSLRHYWRANIVVVLGVATAVAVLGGALIVGDSVRETLRALAVARLGSVDVAMTSPAYFRTALATDLAQDDGVRTTFARIAPIISVEGFVTAQATGRRAGRVRVYGIDDRFWDVHGLRRRGPEARQAFVSPALAAETGLEPGHPMLVRVERPSAVPLESLHGRKDEAARSIRASVVSVLPPAELGEFALSPEQGAIRAVFLPLDWLAAELDVRGRANVIVGSLQPDADRRPTLEPPPHREILMTALARALHPADLGVTVSSTDDVLSVGGEGGLLSEPIAEAARRAARRTGLRTESVFSYLANSIRIGTREIPYSLVTARELGAPVARDTGAGTTAADVPPIVLNSWAARDLQAKTGDLVGLDYYVWVEPGRLVTRQALFRMAGVAPISSSDRSLSPSYEGITDSPTLDEWDPPFPLDLKRIRPADEAYWREYHATPKAFLPIAEGQRLWGSRYGNVTSIRVGPLPNEGADAFRERFEMALREELTAVNHGYVVRDVRAEAVSASAGVTDFGEYFVYFSFFLVVSALVLAALFFKLNVDERVREAGLLKATGARDGFVQRVFLEEAALLSCTGGLLGAAGAVLYAAAIVKLLGSVWIGAVGTTALTIHATPFAVAAGVVGGVAAAAGCTWLALRGVRRMSPRALLAGVTSSIADGAPRPGRTAFAAIASVAVAVGIVAASLAGLIPAAGAFFGAAVFMLTAGLAGMSSVYQRPSSAVLSGAGARALARLGFRNASARPGRSVLSVGVIAAAVFILLAVDVFRKAPASEGRLSAGVGGYSLLAESLVPIAHDLGTGAGLDAVGLSDLYNVRIDSFRVRPGDDTSCLNLYQPSNPRILGVSQAFIMRDRFSFASRAGDDARRENPWTLLNAPQPDGAIPAILDANSLTYVMHKAVGDVIEIPHPDGVVTLRVVAALRDSLFQSEILIADEPFRRLFPDIEGYRFFLIDPMSSSNDHLAADIEDRLSAFAVDVLPSEDRLTEFHRVENTYLATFQTLGGLGLLVGTLGLSAVLLRNVVERRRELALLGAVGYRPWHVGAMLFAESGSLLTAGLAIGAAAACVASLPALVERGGRLPFSTVGLVVVGSVLIAGLLATALAARAATRRPLLGALRSE